MVNIGDQTLPIIAQVVDNAFQTGFAPSLYETLYVHGTQLPSSSVSVQWLKHSATLLDDVRKAQHLDGFWGTDDRINYVPDRILTTLVALRALDQHQMLTYEQLAAAIDYLSTTIPHYLSADTDKKLIAFDPLVIEFLVQLHRRGINIPLPMPLDTLYYYRNDRLSRKMSSIYDRHVTIHSTLDAIETVPNMDWEKIVQYQERDGSMGIYASSTAAMVAQLSPDDPRFITLIDYLNEAMTGNGEFYPFYPSADFERWWALLAIASSPLAPELKKVPLDTSMPVEGISVAESFSLPDIDTASMKATTLLLLGYDTPLDFLDSFYSNGVFMCYENEQRTSPSANIHALMVLAAWSQINRAPVPSRYQLQFRSTLDYVLNALEDRDYYEDKWHLSDLYTTTHAGELFVSLLSLDHLSDEHYNRIRDALDRILGFVLRTRQSDGGFGTEGLSTVEETGYVARLLCMGMHHGSINPDPDILHGAQAFLKSADVRNDPPLWLGKTLYQSLPIAEAQQVSALSWLDVCLK